MPPIISALTPALSLNINDDFGYVMVQADTLEDLFERVARRGEQLATFAASRNAIALAEPKPAAKRAAKPAKPANDEVSTAPLSTADTAGGSEGQPARDDASEAEGSASDAGVKVGKAGNDGAEAAGEADAPAAKPAASAAATYEDVRAAVTKLAGTRGRDAAIAVLDQFGVDHASKLTEAQWPEAVDMLTQALAA